MDFAFTPDQTLLKNSARAFLDEHCTSASVRLLWDDRRGESPAMWKEMAQLGWLGLSLPEEHGGAGLGMVESALVLEELGRAAYPGAFWPTMLLADTVAAHGTSEQKKRWLPAIASGDAHGALALLDTDLDWSPAAVATRAEKTPTGWQLTGLKRYVAWGHVADVLLVPAVAPEGLSLFLVEPGASGIGWTPMMNMDPGTRLADLKLDRVPVRTEDRLGGPGGAAPVLLALLRRGAAGAAAEMLGASRRCLDMAVNYAKIREAFGQPIGSFQAIRHKCADMLLETENSHAAVYYAAWALDAGAEDGGTAASIAKSYVGDASRKVCGEAIQVHGGIGFTWEYDLHMYFKRAKALEAQYGDAEFHRELIVADVAK